MTSFSETIIIGGGPSGIQMGYYLERSKHDYLILERNNNVCSFFEKYPHTRKMISLNKKNTDSIDEDFNLRHDWNSLLTNYDSDTFRKFTEYSDELYPNSDDIVRYMKDFVSNYNLKIQYNTTVTKICKVDDNYMIFTNTSTYTCKYLIIATGLTKNIYPSVKLNIKRKILHYSDYSKDFFTNKTNLDKFKCKKVLIVGGGNSSYELANILNNYCSTIIITGSETRLSSVTHYSGDVRSVYLPFLDTFFLKSLNGIGKRKFTKNTSITEIDGKYFVNYDDTCITQNCYSGEILSNGFDEIIYCTGYKFDNSIFRFDLEMDGKYPKMNDLYESVSNDNLFFIGSLMHYHDYRKSSGGFIHGFRYLIESFFRNKYESPIKYEFISTVELADFIFMRINTSSSLYQMYDFLKDVFYFDGTKYIYYLDISKKSIVKKFKHLNTNLMTLSLSFGPIQYDIRTLGDYNNSDPSFLHPEISTIIKKIYLPKKITEQTRKRNCLCF